MWGDCFSTGTAWGEGISNHKGYPLAWTCSAWVLEAVVGACSVWLLVFSWWWFCSKERSGHSKVAGKSFEIPLFLPLVHCKRHAVPVCSKLLGPKAGKDPKSPFCTSSSHAFSFLPQCCVAMGCPSTLCWAILMLPVPPVCRCSTVWDCATAYCTNSLWCSDTEEHRLSLLWPLPGNATLCLLLAWH